MKIKIKKIVKIADKKQKSLCQTYGWDLMAVFPKTTQDINIKKSAAGQQAMNHIRAAQSPLFLKGCYAVMSSLIKD